MHLAFLFATLGAESRFESARYMFTLFFIYILKKLLKKIANCGNIIIDFIYRFNISRFSYPAFSRVPGGAMGDKTWDGWSYVVSCFICIIF